MTEQLKQTVLLEDKSYLKVTGVEGIINLSETESSILVLGEILEIKGSSLKVEKLSVECKELILTGNINSLKYQDKKEKNGFLKRIFK